MEVHPLDLLLSLISYLLTVETQHSGTQHIDATTFASHLVSLLIAKSDGSAALDMVENGRRPTVPTATMSISEKHV